MHWWGAQGALLLPYPTFWCDALHSPCSGEITDHPEADRAFIILEQKVSIEPMVNGQFCKKHQRRCILKLVSKCGRGSQQEISVWKTQQQQQNKARTSRWKKENTGKFCETEDIKANKTNANLLEKGKEKKRREYTTGRGAWQQKSSGTNWRVERYKTKIGREEERRRKKWVGECVVQRENSLNTVTRDQKDVRTAAPAGIISALPETS